MVGNTAVYLDTSGVVAFLCSDDACHPAAVDAWHSITKARAGFVMTDYVRLECWSLVQRRLGLEAVSDFARHILPLCQVESVGETGFQLLTRQTLLLKQKKLSLVDLSSFDCMQRRGLRHALAFDKHFDQQGFLTPKSRDWQYP
jgi:predicted nucleic acid-binding protein